MAQWFKKLDGNERTLLLHQLELFSLPLSNNCFANVADDASCCRCTRILVVILNETKEKINKTIKFDAN